MCVLHPYKVKKSRAPAGRSEKKRRFFGKNAHLLPCPCHAHAAWVIAQACAQEAWPFPTCPCPWCLGGGGSMLPWAERAFLLLPMLLQLGEAVQPGAQGALAPPAHAPGAWGVAWAPKVWAEEALPLLPMLLLPGEAPARWPHKLPAPPPALL